MINTQSYRYEVTFLLKYNSGRQRFLTYLLPFSESPQDARDTAKQRFDQLEIQAISSDGKTRYYDVRPLKLEKKINNQANEPITTSN